MSSAAEELLKNLMERAGVKKSRKRPRDMVYESKHQSAKWLPNIKTRHVSSNTDLTSSEASTMKQEAKS